MGEKRVATCEGVAFVAQKTHTDHDIWHGYPVGWDEVDVSIQNQWKREKRIRNRDLRRYETREQVRSAFGGSL